MAVVTNVEADHLDVYGDLAGVEEGFRVFLGKVVPVSEHPETIFYSYLTNPRFASPSWYLEGAAVFMETWMAGGLGRAQGAYDEMVFRSMVLDDAHFYDPLGLVAEGTEIEVEIRGRNERAKVTRLPFVKGSVRSRS